MSSAVGAQVASFICPGFFHPFISSPGVQRSLHVQLEIKRERLIEWVSHYSCCSHTASVWNLCNQISVFKALNEKELNPTCFQSTKKSFWIRLIAGWCNDAMSRTTCGECQHARRVLAGTWREIRVNAATNAGPWTRNVLHWSMQSHLSDLNQERWAEFWACAEPQRNRDHKDPSWLTHMVFCCCCCSYNQHLTQLCRFSTMWLVTVLVGKCLASLCHWLIVC